MTINTQTIVDRELTLEENDFIQQYFVERYHQVRFNISDPTNVLCEWATLELANELIATTASFNPPIKTIIID